MPHDKRLIGVALGLAAAGCSGHVYLGKDGSGAEYHDFYASHLFSPSYSILVKNEAGKSEVIGLVGDKTILNALSPAGANAISYPSSLNVIRRTNGPAD
jgi:hypothetical protein